MIARHELAAFTTDLPSARPACKAIDHIIGPVDWTVESRSYSPATDSGQILSDHAAYSIDVTA